jgi:Ni,Fe-hydrogenase III large subunit/Ni,Fe-hydrogenase III component G
MCLARAADGGTLEVEHYQAAAMSAGETMRIDAIQSPGLARIASFAGAPGGQLAQVDADAWLTTATAVRKGNRHLISLWGSVDPDGAFAMCAAYALDDGLLWVRLPLDRAARTAREYPDLSALFPCATRMQRAAHDLTGLRACGAQDTRPWLNHGHWPAGDFPLRKCATGKECSGSAEADYAFDRVTDDGAPEIAVKQIHAGVIGPAHFRFSLAGDRVVRLEARLGYAHRGIERLFARKPALAGHRVAARISGDSTVAYSWAWCQALEGALDITIAPRAQWLRALLLERERIANHLGDLGALANAAGFAFGLTQFSRLKEDWLRLNERAFGHRYLMDVIKPGGLACNPGSRHLDAIDAQCERFEREVHSMQRIYEDHAGLQSRFAGTGTLSRQLAWHLGVRGLVARASGLRMDLRVDHPAAPYREIGARMATDEGADVAARVTLRFREVYESLTQIGAILASLPEGNVALDPEPGRSPSHGMGWVEGSRGDVFVALETGPDGAIVHCHCHDPSWQNWPAVELAMTGNVMADFPLVNHSFNPGYAGHDL